MVACVQRPRRFLVLCSICSGIFHSSRVPELIACSDSGRSEPKAGDERSLCNSFLLDFSSCLFACFFSFQVSDGELLDRFSRRRRPPFCQTACVRRMSSESESGLAALRLTSPPGGMTALWCSLWLSFLLPLCVAPARLPTAQPTGRTQQRC